jgi:cytochrome b6-f complex iron-sulfur subunit
MTQETIKNKISRRTFIKGIIVTAVSFELIYVLFGLIGKKRPKSLNSNFFKAGKVNTFEKGKVYPFSSGLFYLSVFEDGGLLAISIKCTHLGCMVQSDLKEGFICPCHASKFNKYGEVLSPPATRALDIFPIIIEKGEILVDTKQAIQRSKFKKSQLIYI